MNRADLPPLALTAETPCEAFGALQRRPRTGGTSPLDGASVWTGRLQGFDLLDRPLVAEVGGVPERVLAARSTVSLTTAMVGRQVVVVFDCCDQQAPIILGTIEPDPLHDAPAAPLAAIEADGQRHVIEAQREVILRCGEASITLTRAGKVIIEGNYILSRSKGYNKIKGAAIDIN